MADSPSPIAEYERHFNQVKLVNDVFKGSEYSKSHLRQFEREEKEDFENRQKDLTLDNYVFRTIETRKNIIFRKPLDLTNIKNNELEEWFEKDIDLKGTSADEFFKQTLVNCKADGFSYVLVDTPAQSEDIVTSADEKENNIRPYAINLKRQDLFYWEQDSNNNYKVIAFYESYEERDDGLFGFEVKTQIKVHFNDGITQIYRDEELYQEYMRGEEFITVRKFDESDIPPLLDLTKINLKAMNRESEISHYMRQQLSPFLAIYGHQSKNDDGTTVSVNRGLVFNDKDKSGVEWIELKGNSHKAGQEELDRLSKQMELIGVSFNTETSIQTATQVERDATDDESSLTDDATMLEDGINEIIQFFGLLKTDLSVKDSFVIVNKDFSSNTLSPEQQDRLINLFMNNVISKERLRTLLENGEILKVLSEDELATEDTRLAKESIEIEGEL